MFSSIGYAICIPFAWLVRLFYTLTGSYGMAILLFTLAIKLILLPFQLKSKKSMMRMSRMSGKMQEIQKKYANNQTKMNEEIQRLYAEEGVNPMSGCLWSFLPLPILIALYSIIRQPVTHFMMLSADVVQQLVERLTDAGADLSAIVRMGSDGAPVVSNGITQLAPYGQIDLVQLVNNQFPELASDIQGWVPLRYGFIGLDLAGRPMDMVRNFTPSWACIGLILIPILAGASQFFLSRLTMKQSPQQDGANGTAKSMMYTMPLFSVFIAVNMPAALGLYWIAQSGFSYLQEAFLGKFFNKRLQEEEDARAAAIDADRKRRIEQGRIQQEERKNKQEVRPTLKEKKKAAQAAKAAKAGKESTNEAGRIGDRPYARGRSYRADRYEN